VKVELEARKGKRKKLVHNGVGCCLSAGTIRRLFTCIEKKKKKNVLKRSEKGRLLLECRNNKTVVYPVLKKKKKCLEAI
jgi:hypothetical protein